MRVFDWNKAARLIVESKTDLAEAGLLEDWSATGGTIWRDGDPVHDSYTYLASTWATPVVIFGRNIVECWRDQPETPDWDASTKWPASALAILEGQVWKDALAKVGGSK